MQQHGNKLDYDVLHWLIKETLQLCTPFLFLLQYCHADYPVTTQEGKKYTIPKGHIVATSPPFANRLSSVYKDPDSFNPDRSAPGREEDNKADPFSYLAFVGGRQGMSWADIYIHAGQLGF